MCFEELQVDINDPMGCSKCKSIKRSNDCQMYKCCGCCRGKCIHFTIDDRNQYQYYPPIRDTME